MDHKTDTDAVVLRAYAEGRVHHLNRGLCPDTLAGHESRDPDCHVCASLAASAGSEPPPMPETWRVVAHVHGEPILSIGYDWVSGKSELDQADINAVIGMAQHLLAFVGYGLPPSRFCPDADETASAGSEPVAPGSWDHLKLMMEHSAFGRVLQLDDALANIKDFAGLHPSSTAAIREAIANFRLANWVDADGGLGLADALSHLYGDDDIGRASEELDGLADAITDAVSHPSPPEGMVGGWRPIAEAPKTGRTLLLGYFNANGKWRTTRGEWMTQDHIDEYAEEPERMTPGWYETTVENDEGDCWRIEPTHFMPLPPPPLSEEGASHG